MSFEDQLRQTFDRLTDRLHLEVSRHLEETADQLSAGSATWHAGQASLIVSSLADLGRQRSLTAVLETLCARVNECAAASLWSVEGRAVRDWRSTGTFRTLDNDPALAEVVQHGRTLRIDAPADLDRPEQVSSANSPRRVLVPVIVGGAVVAIVDARPLGPGRGSRTDWPDFVEVLARYSGERLQALTATRAAEVFAGRSASERAGAGALEGGVAADIPAGERTSARRYARLLLSEIKLYHEAAVTEGQREGDIESRLAAEISRALALYEARVPPRVRDETDVFRSELVRTLADGDSSRLGHVAG
jgi:hypothetical protein